MKINSTLLICFLLAGTYLMYGQNNDKSVTYLKNGSAIKGVILEIIPDSTIKIQTADESIFIFKMSEVDRIEKDTLVNVVRTVNTYPVPVSAAKYNAVPYDMGKTVKEGRSVSLVVWQSLQVILMTKITDVQKPDIVQECNM